METTKIKQVLFYPDSALVEHAVQRANLTRHEWEAIRMREIESETIESAAEKLDVSPGTIKTRYRKGMKKLSQCWDSLGWIKSLHN